MPKDPAILFYTSDFLTGTITLTDEQVGKYIRLLCIQHQKGYLTEKDMLSICKAYDEDIYSKFLKNTEGRYYNERMFNEAEKRKRYSESRRSNALNPKKDSEAYAKHMENENINEDIIKNEDILLKKEQKFKNEVLAFKKYPVQMLNDFIGYWTEPNKSKIKMRFELEKTWDTGRRLGTWASNESKFDKSKVIKEQPVRKSSNFDAIINDTGRGAVPESIKEILNKYTKQ
jgi:hypothetical protein